MAGCIIRAICPKCGNSNSWNGREARENEKSVVIKHFHMVDTDIMCGKCRNYFWLSSAELIWKSWS